MSGRGDQLTTWSNERTVAPMSGGHSDRAQGQQVTQPPRRKRPLYRRWWFWLLLLVVVVIVIVAVTAGGGTSPNSATTPVNPTTAAPSQQKAPAPSSAAPRTATVGDTVAFSDPSGSGTVTVNGVRWLTQGEGPYPQTPKSGSYLVVNVTVAAKTGQVTPNPLSFRVVAPDGTTTQTTLGVLANQMPSDDLPAGRIARGDVAFDVPRGTPYTLDYGIFGPPEATFSIPQS